MLPAWSATGNPTHDLPSWTREFAANESAIASRSFHCDELVGDCLSALARDAFDQVLKELPAGPCRVWAFLPRPTDPDCDGLDRYMRFNIGRTSAYEANTQRVRVIPAGTCVGHFATNLVVHALWVDGPIEAIENPRQRPAWQYSNRYGPVPPAFTRGMRASKVLIASGTAAVVGEDSVHENSLTLQFEESIQNLAALAAAAGSSSPWRSLQIYVRDERNLVSVRALAQEHFGAHVERVVNAPLCRRELLLEIEGVCDVS